jgi:hypothetical protein
MNGGAVEAVLQSGAPDGTGAIGVILLRAGTPEVLADLVQRLGAAPIPGVGEARVRALRAGADAGGGLIDRALLARVDGLTVLVMPHAGPAVMSEVLAALERAGASVRAGAVLDEDWPEARDAMERRMLTALAAAASPLAVAPLLAQPSLWGDPSTAEPDDVLRRRSAVLRRLIHPPTVVAVGRPNIGKSTLLNALAGRPVALVADEPGTTRDHVGVGLDLLGLHVRWIDAPGLVDQRDLSECTTGAGDEVGEVGAIEREAQRVALDLARRADLLVLCSDPLHAAPDPAVLGFEDDERGGLHRPQPLRVGLRADLGCPQGDCDVVCSLSPAVPSEDHGGIEGVVRAVRDRLLPPEVLRDGERRRWVFWD